MLITQAKDLESKSIPFSKTLQKHLLVAALFNLLLVALLGLTLRSYTLISLPLDYKNLLHGHSHFAFGGWIMPILTWAILEYFPELVTVSSYRHWRNIIIIILVSAYGMLLSFPFQGYGPISISFSTLAVLASFYLAFVLWHFSKNNEQRTSLRFLKAGAFYLVLSSLGPFATGPLIALGKAGSPIYYNAIYFYLHFQYNGWFCFVVFAVLYKLLERQGLRGNGNSTYTLFNIACVPSFFLSLLWNHPTILYNVIGGVAAALQLAGIIYLRKDLSRLKENNPFIKKIQQLAFAALAFKMILQLTSAIPSMADLAYKNRNFVIAYLHLVLLGCISLYSFSFILKANPGLNNKLLKRAILGFIFSFITTETLLIAQPLLGFIGKGIPNYNLLLFSCSLIFPLSIGLIWWLVRNHFADAKPLHSYRIQVDMQPLEQL